MFLKFLLFVFIIYYVLRLFIRPFLSGYRDEKRPPHANTKRAKASKNISDEIGEYIEYEEVEENK